MDKATDTWGVVFSRAAIYEGDLINNKRHGKGKLTDSDGATYEGDFVDGEYVTAPETAEN